MRLTNDLRGDGFGAQYQSILWSIIFAEVNGHTFFYSNIETMNNGLHTDTKFIEDAVKCMNVKGNYPDVHDVAKVAPPHDLTVYALKWPYFYKEIEHDMERFHSSESFTRVKNLFYKGKESPFDDKHFHVAVHIRKLVKYDKVFETDTRSLDDSYYINCMEAIQHTYSKTQNKPILFHMYSVGNEEEFTMYKKFPIQFHLEDDTFESFIGMVFADMLVICPSSMSYTAGLLSNGIVIYKPFWHPPRMSWLTLETK